MNKKLLQLPPFIYQNVSLADKNWFKTGGNARFFAVPSIEKEFEQAIFFAQKNDLPLFILGKGANILIADSGFQGMVIRPELQNISIACQAEENDSVLVTAGAGVGFERLIEYCFERSIIGLEEFSGIPTTVGGAIYINLHYFEFLIEQFLVSARVMEQVTGQIKSVTVDWFQFAYDHSRLHQK